MARIASAVHPEVTDPVAEVAASRCLDAEGEAAELLDRASPPLAPRRTRRLAVGAGLALALVGPLVVGRAVAPCGDVAAAGGEPPPLVTFVEEYPEDLVHLGPPEARNNALARWLQDADAAAAGVDGAVADAAIERKATAAIQEAMNYSDPKKAERFVKEQMHQAALRSQRKRRELKRIIDEDNKNAFLPRANQERHLEVNTSDPADQAQLTGCIFDATGLANSVARLGANINDLANTCTDVKFNDFFNSHDAHTKVCSINLAAVITSVVGLATSGATVADSCTFTMLPQINALCSSTITGLMTAIAGMGGGVTLMAASCTTTGWYNRIPPGVTPSNVGSNARHELKKAGLIPDERRLSENEALLESFMSDWRGMAANSSGHAPGRRLLFGGGKGSLAAQCATSIISLQWSIAYLALNINSAANKDAGASCPPKGVDLIKTVTRNLCNVDISSAITSFISIILFIEWIVWQCTDEINLPAICGSGATALLASMAGVSKAASGMYVACEIAQRPVLKFLLDAVGAVGGVQGAIGRVPTPDFGRRLMEARENVVSGLFQEEIAELQRQYKSPAEVYKSIGYDFEDIGAAWRQEAEISASDIVVTPQTEAPASVATRLGAFFAGGRCAA